MGGPEPGHDHHVRRAVKLLQARDTKDVYRKVAIEKKLKEMPPHVVAAAHSHLANGGGSKRHGPVTDRPIELSPTSARMDHLKDEQKVARIAVGLEIQRYIEALQQGHRQGIKDFRTWYRDWKDAQEDGFAALARFICGFLAEAGLDLIFPEEEVLYKVIKAIAKKGYTTAADQVEKMEAKARNVEGFLDSLESAEEKAITALLDAKDQLFANHAEEIDKAVGSMVDAFELKDWKDTEKLPPETLAVLAKLGVGVHGSAAATTMAERVLAAHIESVYRANAATVQGSGGQHGPVDIEVQAEIAALKHEQNLPSVDNRERIFELERKLPSFFRMMVDINSEGAETMHFRLNLDRDVAKDIVTSRDEHGPFRSSKELETRKILSAESLKEIEGVIVCH
jgi:DNA uptake protein ComE-like DNA-binding protein